MSDEKNSKPEAPQTYKKFIKRFPKLGEAWSLIGQGDKEGPLDSRTTRLIKLAIAVGAMREGPVHSGVRKALSEGISREEIEQTVSLAASTLGLPSTVAVYTWIQDNFKDE